MNDLAGVHGLSVFSIGFLMRPWAEEQAANLANPTEDSSLFLGTGDPNVRGVAHLRWRFRDLPDRLDANGIVIRSLGQQWVVTVAAEWNENFRRRFAVAEGVEPNEIAESGMADINRMGNDVIHHSGIASERNSGRCEVFRWFAPGEVIHPMLVHVAEFMAYLGLLHDAERIDGGPWLLRESQ
jgi:uncharacterized SAM-binding protein YcdF (DUF218 family)